MIRTLLALDGALIRGALAFVLTMQPDIEVVAEVDRPEEIEPALRTHRPQVSVIDLNLFGPDGPPGCEAGSGRESFGPILLLVDRRRAGAVAEALRGGAEPLRDIGFLGNDVAPERVVEGVRRLFRGEPVVDGGLVAAALTTASPLTSREAEILGIAATGWPIKEIAAKLSLAPGTVRNHLSRIAAKCGARTRIEAVRIARDAGWI
nr:response regulator transcription factor [Micromonospora sp. DSM 115978]